MDEIDAAGVLCADVSGETMKNKIRIALDGLSARSVVGLGLLSVLLLGGCATEGRLLKLEHFADYAPCPSRQCIRANYYRVRVLVFGENGRVDYRSGWYDANAVDDLFGNISSQHNERSLIAAEQRRAIQQTYARYVEALLADSPNQTVIDTRRQAYDAARGGISGVATLGGSPLDHTNHKFVMILSNDPSDVIAAIQGKVEQNQLVDSVALLLAQERLGETVGAAQEKSANLAQLDSVITFSQSTSSALTDSTNAADLKVYLAELIQLLDGG